MERIIVSDNGPPFCSIPIWSRYNLPIDQHTQYPRGKLLGQVIHGLNSPGSIRSMIKE